MFPKLQTLGVISASLLVGFLVYGANKPSFKTVDNYLRPGNTSEAPWSLSIDDQDAIYVEGPSGHHWMTRKSVDHGKTWKTIDDYDGADIVAVPNENYSMKVTPDGTVYIVGSVIDKTLKEYWFVRRGEKHGAKMLWSNIDKFQLATGHSAMAAGIGFGPDGSVYVGGNAHSSNETVHWLIRRLKPGQKTWQTVDDLPGGTPTQHIGVDTTSTDIITGPDGTVYASGWWTSNDGKTSGVVRRQNPQDPTSWEYDSLFQLSNESNSSVLHKFAKNDAGDLFIVGSGNDSDQHANCVIRKKGAADSDWQTLDVFNTSPAGCNFFAVAARKNMVFAAGNTFEAVAGSTTGEYKNMSVVRASADGGKTWNTLELAGSPAGFNRQDTGIGIDSLGNVFVTGYSEYKADASRWVTRQLVDWIPSMTGNEK